VILPFCKDVSKSFSAQAETVVVDFDKYKGIVIGKYWLRNSDIFFSFVLIWNLFDLLKAQDGLFKTRIVFFFYICIRDERICIGIKRYTIEMVEDGRVPGEIPGIDRPKVALVNRHYSISYIIQIAVILEEYLYRVHIEHLFDHCNFATVAKKTPVIVCIL